MLRSNSAGLAAGILVAFAASAAYAGSPVTVITSPPAATAGTSVILTASFEFNCGADAGTVSFTDLTNGNDPLCSVALTQNANPTTGTCPATFGGAPGDHTVRAVFSGTATCNTQFGDGTHTVLATTAVPTMTEWTMWGLAGLIALGGGVLLSRRARRLV